MDSLVGCPEGSGVDRLPNGDPGRAHVFEFQRTGPGVLEVANQLAKDPRLVRVSDTPVFFA